MTLLKTSRFHRGRLKRLKDLPACVLCCPEARSYFQDFGARLEAVFDYENLFLIETLQCAYCKKFHNVEGGISAIVTECIGAPNMVGQPLYLGLFDIDEMPRIVPIGRA